MSAAVSTLPARVRPADDGDIRAICRIEKAVYEFPWTRGIFRDCLHAGYVCLVQENARGVFGYGIMSSAEGECHILNLCIEPAYQGVGWGRNLLQHLLRAAADRRSRVVFLEVRVSNERAFRLYHQLGFNEVAMRNNYYPATGGGREHARVLAKMLVSGTRV